MILPYAKQSIDQDDIRAVVNVLKSDFITTGPKVKEFEKKFSKYVGSKYAVALPSGTTALFLSCLAADLKKGDQLITSPLTFAASADCALYCQAKPIFVDINNQGLIDENLIEKKINKKTKIIIPVHYAGLPCYLDKIKAIAKKYNLIIIEDGAHALGARYKNSKIGDCQYSEMTIFSFHPVKHITTGEGGMITTNDRSYYEKLLLLRFHGITKDPAKLKNKKEGPWHREKQINGFNFMLTDFQSALGISQLKKINKFLKKRREIAKRYDKAFKDYREIEIINESKDQYHAYHLYIIRVKDKKIRLKLFKYLKKQGIYCQVHYLPVYLHPYYQKLGYKKGLCPQAEDFYQRVISLPLYPSLTKREQDFVIRTILKFFK